MPEVRFTGTDKHDLHLARPPDVPGGGADDHAYFPNSDTWSVKTNRIEPRDLGVTGDGAAGGPWCLWRGLEAA